MTDRHGAQIQPLEQTGVQDDAGGPGLALVGRPGRGLGIHGAATGRAVEEGHHPVAPLFLGE